MRCPVHTYATLYRPTQSGPDLGYSTTRMRGARGWRGARFGQDPGIALRACYAMSGTRICYADITCVRDAMSGASIDYGM
eukprot:2983896-Rhodomonas_salina.3